MTAAGLEDVLHDAAQRYLDFLQARDRGGALSLAGELARDGVPVQRILVDVVAAAQREVGRRWQAGSWSVTQEHAATAISESVVAAVCGRNDDAGATRGSVAVACAENEWHALPARLVGEILRLSGWSVTFLGASLSSGRLAQFLHDTGPHAVALSCSLSSALPHARRLIEASRESGVPVLVGGSGFGSDPSRAAMLGANAWARTPAEAVALLEHWTPYSSPPPPLDSPWLDEYGVVHLHRHALARDVVARLEHEPLLQGPGRAGVAAEDVDALLDHLAAALFVADPTVFTDYVQWMLAVAGTRGAPTDTVVLSLDALQKTLSTGVRADPVALPAAAGLVASAREGGSPPHVASVPLR